MKSARYSGFIRGHVIALLSVSFALSALGQETVTLKWQETGLKTKFEAYRPHVMDLATTQPAEIKKLPPGTKDLRFATLKMGPAASPVVIGLAYEEKDGHPYRLYVDGNGNGDLTDEPAHEWIEKKVQTRDGNEGTSISTEAMVTIPFESGPKQAHLKFFQVVVKTRNGEKTRLGYINDYGLTGEVKSFGKPVSAVLDDSACNGDFKLAGSPSKQPLLWLDFNGNGKLDQGELVLGSQPFQVEDKWWALADMKPDGSSFRIVPSTKPEPKKVEGPDLTAGHQAPAFTTKLLGGKDVKFPDDYKGKIVLLDFWATWCGPCVEEMPNVAKAYRKFHGKGFDILGVTLDQENSEQTVVDFTSDNEMPWPQVYDGKFWEAAVARLYGIQSIPHMILIDGDSGKILVDQDIQAEKLEPAIEKALAGKTGKSE